MIILSLLKAIKKNLFEQVVEVTESQPPRSQTRAVDISHGRHLIRKVSVFDIWPRHNYIAVTNLSLLTTIALNLYRFLGFSSLTCGQRWLNYKL
jgi:hypothetical protein